MSQQSRSTYVITDPTQILAALVGLKDIKVLHLERRGPDIALAIEQLVREVRYPTCGVLAQVKDRPLVRYIGLPVNGSPSGCAGRSTGCAVRTVAAPRGAGS